MAALKDNAIITCAVTGNLTTSAQTPYLPITPRDIADAAIAAAEAGAAIAHIHVRNIETGAPSMALDLYGEVFHRLRSGCPELIVNLTTGPGGRFVPSVDDPRQAAPGTTLMLPERRVEHIALLKPEICTLDLNTMNSGPDVVINTPQNVRRMARIIAAAGSKPEIELFDSGDIALMRDLVQDGTLATPLMCSLVMGVKYGFQPGPETVLYARSQLPPNTQWTAFGIGRMSFPMVAQSVLAGGHVRVGLEDTVYLSKGVLARSNAEMVVKARQMLGDIGVRPASFVEARRILGLSGEPQTADLKDEAAAIPSGRVNA